MKPRVNALRKAVLRTMRLGRTEAVTMEGYIMQRLILERKNAGLSQSEVGRRMKASQSLIVRLEGQRHSPTMLTICRYAVAIGVDLDVKK